MRYVRLPISKVHSLSIWKMEIIIAPALPIWELFWGLNQIKYTEVLEKLEDLYKYKMIGVTDIATVAYKQWW